MRCAKTGLVFVAGTFLRIPFSDRKYLTNFIRESGGVTIEFMSELLRRKTVKVAVSEIKNFEQSKSLRLIEKPSELTVTSSTQTLTSTILDNKFQTLASNYHL